MRMSNCNTDLNLTVKCSVLEFVTDFRYIIGKFLVGADVLSRVSIVYFASVYKHNM